MTIIVARKYENEIIMCADSYSITDNYFIGDHNAMKIKKFKYVVVGCAGEVGLIHLFNKYIEDYEPFWHSKEEIINDLIKFYENTSTNKYEDAWLNMIIVNIKKKTIYCVRELSCIQKEKFAAIGMGEDIALGALEMDASPYKAIELVYKYYPCCGGDILETRIQEIGTIFNY